MEHGYSFQGSGTSARGGLGSVLGHFSDLFSHFSRHLAPAYHHDRCERSLQMRLYTMHKREFVVLFVAFFVSLFVVVLIGMAGPAGLVEFPVKASELPCHSAGFSIASGPYVIKSPGVTRYSQEMWLRAVVYVNGGADETFDKRFTVAVDVEGLTEGHEKLQVLKENQLFNRSRHLQCVDKRCAPVSLLHLTYISFTNYLIVLRLHGLEDIDQRYTVNEILFQFQSFEPSFTQLELWFHFIFLLISFSVTCWFGYSLRRFSMQDWSLEQRWTALLLLLLMAHNNPLFPLLFLCSSVIPRLLDAIMQMTLVCALLLCWICILHGLRQTSRSWLTFYVPKLLMVGLMWVLCLVLIAWRSYLSVWDPTFSDAELVQLQSIDTVFYILGGFYIVYVLILVLRAYSDLRSMPYLGIRLKITCVSILVMASVGLSLTSYRLSQSGARLTPSAVLAASYTSSTQFLAIYGLLNIFICCMAYVFSPPFTERPGEARVVKDNPALSMINDSDEDVIYGSDEESRRPLHHNNDDDDSD